MSSVGTKWDLMEASNVIRFWNITCAHYTENTAYMYMNRPIKLSTVYAFHIVDVQTVDVQ